MRQTAKMRAAIAWIDAHWPKRRFKLLGRRWPKSLEGAKPAAEIYSTLKRYGVHWIPPREGENRGRWERVGAKSIGVRVTADTVAECDSVLESLRRAGHRVVAGAARPMRAGQIGVYAEIGPVKRQ